MINNIYQSKIQTKYYDKGVDPYFIFPKCNPVFGNKISIPYKSKFQKIENIMESIAFLKRKVRNVFARENYINHDKIYGKFIGLKEDSKSYMATWFDYGKALAKKKEIEINIENEELMNIVKSDESCIFIMNHDNQKQDPKLLGFFNSLLAREYILNGKAETCPKPKILVNNDILKSLPPKLRLMREKLGLVGVDASLFGADGKKNALSMLSTLKSFIKNKTNIFIFPEGKMCTFKNLDLEYKFQTGIADTINKVTKTKNQVKVIPLGFAYKKKVGSIHIGEPVYFKREGEQILSTRGNILSEFASPQYTNFFGPDIDKRNEFKIITKDGISVEGKDLSDYIAGILCENLKICKEEAKKAFYSSNNKNDYVYYADL